MKAGQLVEFYSDGLLQIHPVGCAEMHVVLKIKAGDIGMLIRPASNYYDYATVLVDEKLVIIRSGGIRVYVENGFKEMLKRAGVGDGEKE